MKRSKKLLYLFGILVVVSLLTIVVKSINQKKEDIALSGETIIEVSEADITTLNWEYSGNEYSLVKEDDKWYKSEDKDFPIDQDLVAEMLSEVQRIGAAFIINDVSDYDQYGLKSPSMYISFKTEDEEYTLNLGNYSSMDEERYADIGDGNVYLLSEDPSETFALNYDDLFAYEELPDLSNFQTYKISGENSLDISVKENNSDSYTSLYKYYLKDGQVEKTLSNSLTETLVNRISDLEFLNYVDYQGNLATYGLDEPRITIDITYLDEDDNEQNFKCYLSNLSDESENEEAYFNIAGSNCIYEISGGTLDIFLSEDYQSLRPTEVLLVDPSEVNSITIELDDEEYVINSETKDEQTTYYYDEKDVDFGDCLDSLMAIEVKDFNSQSPTKKLELNLVVKTNNKEVKLAFYKYDNNYMLYRQNGVTIGYASRSEVLDLIEEINAIVLATNQDE